MIFLINPATNRRIATALESEQIRAAFLGQRELSFK